MAGELITALIDKLGTAKVLTGEDVASRYHHIWKMNESLQAVAVLLPGSTDELAAAVKICHHFRQPIVVHGGLTNLVGSTETQPDELVVSMEKMNLIEEVDVQSRAMTVQAGAILEDIQNAALEKDLLFPLNFGAKGSAQIGGIISTNAGGLRVFRFGMTRALILGLEVVLADGTIINSLKKMVKDNSAYDLKQLFIGAEGTLGIVSRAVLKLVERPKSRVSAFIGINEYNKVLSLFKFMDGHLAGTLSGFELIWKNTYSAMTSPPAIPKPPLPHDYNYYILMEGLGSHPQKDQERLEELLAEALEKELIMDAVIAHGDSDMDWFWKIREDVHVLTSLCNHDQHFDISLPIPLIGEFVDQVMEKLLAIPKVEKAFAFGHVADGNIHFIVGKSEQTESLIKQINDCIYQPLQAIGGSVSAEHGIGLHKKAYLSLCRSPEEIALMKSLKHALDPLNLLNRGKVLD